MSVNQVLFAAFPIMWISSSIISLRAHGPLGRELYGSINIAEINEGVDAHEHEDNLRNIILWR